MIRFTSFVRKFHSNLWGYHIPIPPDTFEIISATNARRFICNINSSIELRCAIMHSKEYPFIMMNAQTIKRNGLLLEQKVDIRLSEDLSEYGMDMPDELEELLSQEPEGRQHFDNLTKGKQRSLIYLVLKVKNSQSRLRKALAIVEHLKESSGRLNFKALNQKIKFYNNL